MNRLDRALGILLQLRRGRAISAAALARRFEVSPRTIYRDVEMLSSLGVPVYAQRGRGGGLRLLEGYFLPPVTFTEGEALALAVGLALLGSLRSKPLATDLETAGAKLAAALPDALREILVSLDRHIGFEVLQEDIFHPEPVGQGPEEHDGHGEGAAVESEALSAFVRSMVNRSGLLLRYRSPYRGQTEEHLIAPLGAFWDRGYWYLAAQEASADNPRLWRADRVLSAHPDATPVRAPTNFDVRAYLGRQWLASAMRQWAEEAPVRVRMTRAQAERLRRDWYYRQAGWEPLPGGDVVMTFGESERETVFELLRWLGPGAELLEPEAWRAALREQLAQMAAIYRPHPRR
jgi:predicted DNA-binding transcriptional regulator YafY